jgi:hypothetical protein
MNQTDQKHIISSPFFGLSAELLPSHRSIFAVSILLMAIALTNISCERDTKLTVGEGNPPKFSMTGNGRLTSLRLRGPDKQRDAEGEDAFLYWVIETKGEATDRNVVEVSPIIYGKIPDGYKQIYPEKAGPPPLIEGERYHVQVVTMNANGDSKYFSIRNGKVEVSDY